MSPKLDYQCLKCGSDDVSRDAYAAWNANTQEWELQSVQDNAVCQNCGYAADYYKFETQEVAL
jgi:DNA-directed RNA polymerase subunit RPC12/RpoP